MAVFAKYDGIDGESQDAHHQHWIDVLSLDWGVHRPEGKPSGAGRRRGRAIVEDMALMMEYDKAAPKLLEKALNGEVIPTLTVELTATYGGARQTYLKYELKSLVVTSYQVSASGDDQDGPPVVMVENGFEEIKVTYTEFGSDGSKKGNVETSWKRPEDANKPKKKKKK